MKIILFICTIFLLPSCSFFHTPSQSFIAPNASVYIGPNQESYIANTLHHEINTNSPLALIDDVKVYYAPVKLLEQSLEHAVYQRLYSILLKDNNLKMPNKIAPPFWTIALDFNRSGTTLNATLLFTSPTGEKSSLNRNFEINK
ncbi:MAG: hypothetical protein ACRC37_06525 [Lentisphaeria bacterium]